MKHFPQTHKNRNLLKQHTHELITSQQTDYDGLFSGKKQKQLIIQRLKKGTLFRLSNQLKPKHKIIQKDPYLNWLHQNSIIDSVQNMSKHTMGETFFYLNTQDFQKQKKLSRSIFPQIQKSIQIKKLPVSLNSFQMKQTNQNTQQFRFKVSGKKNKEKIVITKSQNHPLLINSSYRKVQNQIHNTKNCIEQKLSKTQLFSADQQDLRSNSLYLDKQNLIKNNFYLNDHKKYPYSKTFYIKPDKIRKEDNDLARVNALDIDKVKTFNQNLRRMQKKGNVTCYNQLSTYFGRMRQQLGNFTENQRNCKNILKQKNNQSKCSNLIRLSQFQCSQNSDLQKKDKNEHRSLQSLMHLPKFLMKSIQSPKKLAKSPIKIIEAAQKMRA